MLEKELLPFIAKPVAFTFAAVDSGIQIVIRWDDRNAANIPITDREAEHLLKVLHDVIEERKQTESGAGGS